MRNKRLIDMREEELQQLIFNTAKGANNLLFDGIAKRFLLQMEEDMRVILERLEKLELLVKMLIESKQEVKKEVNVEERKKKDNSLIEALKSDPKLQKALGSVDFKKSLEEAMKLNTLRTIPIPKVDLPEFKKGDDNE